MNNFSHPYAPNPAPHEIARPILEFHNPDLPWQNASRMRQMFTAVEEAIVSRLGKGSSRCLNAPTKHHLYVLYSLICEAFVRQSGGFMPRIVAFANLEGAHHAALNLLEQHGRVKVMWFRPPLEATNFALEYAELPHLINANTVLVAMPLQTTYGRIYGSAELDAILSLIHYDTPTLMDVSLAATAGLDPWIDQLGKVALFTIDLKYLGGLDMQVFFAHEAFVNGTQIDLSIFEEAPYPAVFAYKRAINVAGQIMSAAPWRLDFLARCRDVGVPAIVSYATYHSMRPATAIVTINDVVREADAHRWDTEALVFVLIKGHRPISARQVQEHAAASGVYLHGAPMEKIKGMVEDDPLLANALIATSLCPLLPLLVSQLLLSAT